MPCLEEFASSTTKSLESLSLLRKLETCHRKNNCIVSCNEKNLISFSCNDYLGITQRPEVKQAAIDAINKYGTGAGASRLITGNHPLYAELESKLAHLKGTESAIVTGSGYLVNIGAIPAIVGRGDLILMDRLVHSCILDGTRISGARTIRFAHNNCQALARLLEVHRDKFRHCLIAIEHVYSMDGDIADIDEIMKLAKQHDCWVLVDDAHGLGVIDYRYGQQKPDLQIGTLSKAIGAYGGYVCTNAAVAQYLTNKMRSLIYSTALPPMVIAAANAALDLIIQQPEIAHRAMYLAKIFCDLLGLPTPKSTIVPIILKSSDEALTVSHRLKKHGFLVTAIRSPTVPTPRLRLTFSANHKEEDVKKLASILKQLLQ